MPDPNHDIRTLVDTTFEAADILEQPGTVFDATTAGLLLINAYTASTRLDPAQFDGFNELSKETIRAAGAAANKLAPMSDDERQKQPGESEDEYLYRVTVHHPLHHLQDRLHARGYTPASPEEDSEVRHAVKLAALAFAAITQEASKMPELDHSWNYFMTNAAAAAARIKRLRNQAS